MSDIKFSLKRLLKKPDKTDDKDSNSRLVHTETGKNIGKDVGKQTGDKIIKSDASPSPLHVAQSLPSPIPSPITSPAAVGQAQTPVGANNSSTLPNAPGENDELINKLSHKFDGLSSTKNGETVAPVANSLTPVLSPNSISSDGSRSLQVPSDKNDKKSKSRNVSQTSSINGKVAKSGPYSVQNSNNITHVSSHSSLSSPAKERPRFKMLELGNHTHCLRAAKRQEKLSNMLKDLLGAKRLRDEAKSAIPVDLQNVVGNNTSEKLSQTSSSVAKPPTLFSGLVHSMKLSGGEVNPSPSPSLVEMNSTSNDSRCFVEKYGRCQEVIGKGSFGVVRVSHKKVIGEKDAEEKLYAVKEFKRRPQESEKKYNRRLTSEFCISSSLKHLNIIDTLDLLKDAKGDYCEVMEYCAGGDLYTLIITAGKLEYAEADCFFKQLITGVNYMHDMGVSHRDLKPENILITQNGVLKITDFGNGECFRMAWEEQIQYSEGVCGSSPYIAPEEFTQQSFDPRKVDIWACGVIYMAMRTGRQLWKLADEKKDVFFEEYLVKRKEKGGYEPIESLKRARCRNVIYSILDPKPDRRITGKQILNSEWGREIKVCDAGRGISPDASPITGPI